MQDKSNYDPLEVGITASWRDTAFWSDPNPGEYPRREIYVFKMADKFSIRLTSRLLQKYPHIYLFEIETINKTVEPPRIEILFQGEYNDGGGDLGSREDSQYPNELKLGYKDGVKAFKQVIEAGLEDIKCYGIEMIDSEYENIKKFMENPELPSFDKWLSD